MQKSFLNQVATLLTGTVIAQFVVFGFTLVVARLYGSEDFGYLSAFSGVLAILVILATGSYDKALMFARSRRAILALIVLVLLLGLMVSALVLMFGLVGFLLSISFPYGLSNLDFFLLMPFAIMVTVVSQLAVCIFLKSSDTRAISIAKILQASVTGWLQTFGGIFGVHKFLVVGNLLGLLIFIPIIYQKIFQYINSVRKSLRLAVLSSALKYQKYPKYICPTELIDAFSNQLPLLLIGWFFSLATLGQYSLAQRILAGPAAIVGQAVAQIFFKYISHDRLSATNIHSLILRVWLNMALIGALPFLMFFFYGESIFTMLFGADWSEAGSIAEVLSLLLFFKFVSSPTSTIYYRLGIQKAQLIFCLVAFFVRTGPFIFIKMNSDFYALLWMQVIGEILVIIMFNIFAVMTMKKQIHLLK